MPLPPDPGGACLPRSPDPGREGVPPSQALAQRIVDLVRTLRAAGVPLGVGRSALALKAVERIDVGNRAEFSNGIAFAC